MQRDHSLLRLLIVSLCSCAAVVAPRAVQAQRGAPALEGFVASVARLWGAGDAGGITALAAGGDRIVLDLGSGQAEPVEARHASAALRDLFRDRATVSVRPAQVTIAGGSPLRGFGELTWVSRPRGVSDNETATVYVGAVLEDGAWRIRELRVLR